MQIEEMTIADIESRMTEIESEIETKSGEELETAKAETVALLERKAELEVLEQRKADAEAIANNTITDVKIIEERKEERKIMDIKEYRNSAEYVNAFAEFIKTGKDEEIRSLLTTNVSSGDVAVPDLVYDIVKTNWNESGIMSLVKRISVQGNMKVQFELSAGDAVVHTEGSGAVSEEELTLGIVTLVPASIKKWISVSDEVMDMAGEAFLQYVYAELTHKIVVKCEETLIDKIAALSTTASDTAVSAQQYSAGAAVSTIATALGQLSAEAKNPVIVMNPATKAAFIAAGLSANYAVDVFQGLPVYTTNDLPALSSASEGDVYAIVGDFGYGALANFPNGEGVQIKVDDKTQMEYDLVRILGREYVAVEPIACDAFVNILAPASV